MNKLSDLELEKRISVIEGVDVVIDDGGGWWTYIKSPGSAVKVLIAPYHPLTDDALCFRLMIKHSDVLARSSVLSKDDDASPRLVLEAIVEANND